MQAQTPLVLVACIRRNFRTQHVEFVNAVFADSSLKVEYTNAFELD
jgi:hypothetical protein